MYHYSANLAVEGHLLQAEDEHILFRLRIPIGTEIKFICSHVGAKKAGHDHHEKANQEDDEVIKAPSRFDLMKHEH